MRLQKTTLLQGFVQQHDRHRLSALVGGQAAYIGLGDQYYAIGEFARAKKDFYQHVSVGSPLSTTVLYCCVL